MTYYQAKKLMKDFFIDENNLMEIFKVKMQRENKLWDEFEFDEIYSLLNSIKYNRLYIYGTYSNCVIGSCTIFGIDDVHAEESEAKFIFTSEKDLKIRPDIKNKKIFSYIEAKEKIQKEFDSF